MSDEIKVCTILDLNDLMNIVEKNFGDKIKDYKNIKMWGALALANTEKVRVLRTENSFLLGFASSAPDNPEEPYVVVQYFAGNRPEIDSLFQALKVWAQEKGANKIFFQPKTGYNAAPLAETLGAEPDFPAYVWRI